MARRGTAASTGRRSTSSTGGFSEKDTRSAQGKAGSNEVSCGGSGSRAGAMARGPTNNGGGGPWMGSVGLSTGFLFCFFCAINRGGRHKTTATVNMYLPWWLPYVARHG